MGLGESDGRSIHFMLITRIAPSTSSFIPKAAVLVISRIPTTTIITFATTIGLVVVTAKRLAVTK